MTSDQIEGFATEVALVIKAALAPLQERIAVLEARAQRLEAMEEARLAGLEAKVAELRESAFSGSARRYVP